MLRATRRSRVRPLRSRSALAGRRGRSRAAGSRGVADGGARSDETSGWCAAIVVRRRGRQEPARLRLDLSVRVVAEGDDHAAVRQNGQRRAPVVSRPGCGERRHAALPRPIRAAVVGVEHEDLGAVGRATAVGGGIVEPGKRDVDPPDGAGAIDRDGRLDRLRQRGARARPASRSPTSRLPLLDDEKKTPLLFAAHRLPPVELSSSTRKTFWLPPPSMPQAMSAWPAEVDPECGSAAGGQTADRPVGSRPPTSVRGNGGATLPSSATTAAVSGASGSTAMAGLCCGPVPDDAGLLRREHPRAQRRGRQEQRGGCPDDEHEHVRSSSHQEQGAGSGKHDTPLQ